MKNIKHNPPKSITIDELNLIQKELQFKFFPPLSTDAYTVDEDKHITILKLQMIFPYIGIEQGWFDQFTDDHIHQFMVQLANLMNQYFGYIDLQQEQSGYIVEDGKVNKLNSGE